MSYYLNKSGAAIDKILGTVDDSATIFAFTANGTTLTLDGTANITTWAKVPLDDFTSEIKDSVYTLDTANDRITYNGSESIRVRFDGKTILDNGPASKLNIRLKLYKNGSPVNEGAGDSIFTDVYLDGASDSQNAVANGIISLGTGDYFEIFYATDATGTDLFDASNFEIMLTRDLSMQNA